MLKKVFGFKAYGIEHDSDRHKSRDARDLIEIDKKIRRSVCESFPQDEECNQEKELG